MGKLRGNPYSTPYNEQTFIYVYVLKWISFPQNNIFNFDFRADLLSGWNLLLESTESSSEDLPNLARYKACMF